MASVLLVLALIYGVGYLCFAFWDGGMLTKSLMALGLALLIWAGWASSQAHRVKF